MVTAVIEFRDGDVVQLKSGGPLMTIQSVHRGPDGLTAFCEWFDGKKQMGASFRTSSLLKDPDRPVFA